VLMAVCYKEDPRIESRNASIGAGENG